MLSWKNLQCSSFQISCFLRYLHCLFLLCQTIKLLNTFIWKTLNFHLYVIGLDFEDYGLHEFLGCHRLNGNYLNDSDLTSWHILTFSSYYSIATNATIFKVLLPHQFYV
jgi:hypothetical protein